MVLSIWEIAVWVDMGFVSPRRRELTRWDSAFSFRGFSQAVPIDPAHM